MKTPMLRLVVGLMLVSIVVGCVGPAEGGVLQSGKSRLTSDATEAKMADQVAGNSAFAFDLYQNSREGNLFCSPHSISLALAMTYAGARAETEEQMAETLHFTLPPDRLHPVFSGLDLELAQRSEGAMGKEGEGFRLDIVNALWGQESYKFLSEFLGILAEHYGAGLGLFDFETVPEEAREAINDWVSDQTEGGRVSGGRLFRDGRQP